MSADGFPSNGQRASDLAQRIAATCWLDGTFTLHSGRQADTYFDKLRFEADPALLGEVASRMAPLIPPDTELLAGLELGAIPLVAVLSHLTGIHARFVRKQRKTYGTGEQIEGGLVAGRRVTIIEDVVTSGKAVLQAAEVLRAAGAEVTHAVCVADRGDSAAGALRAAGIEIHPLFAAADVERA